jgi:alpha-tubulin suppressor-like RCC1 family protein
MGGFGFGLLADVQMLGFYQAQHTQTLKPFLAYVIQVTTTSAQSFLIYRRYSQIAALATKLHFHPSVGLPPKYALQVFPLTEDQLRQRFEGLEAFIAEVFTTLSRQHDDGLQHDVNSMAGLDMQIFYDFVSHQRNRPPVAVKALPDWATPTGFSAIMDPAASESSRHLMSHFAAATDLYPVSRASSVASSVEQADGVNFGGPHAWQDVDSMDSEEACVLVDYDESSTSGANGMGGEHISNQFRNEILQAEGNLNALWNCIKAYESATKAWWSTLGTVVDEYKRVSEMALFKVARNSDGSTARKGESTLRVASSSLVAVQREILNELQVVFDHTSREQVMVPLENLVRDLLPEVKHSYWTRLANMQQTGDLSGGGRSGLADTVNVRRLLQERDGLHERVREDVQDSMASLLRLQSQLLESINAKMLPHKPADSPAADATVSDEDTELNAARDAIEDDSARSAEENENVPSNTVDPDDVAEAVGSTSSITEEDDANQAARLWLWGRAPKSESGSPLLLRPKEVSVLPGQTIVQVACGGEHLLYLTDGGDVYSFGDNDDKKAASTSGVPPSSFVTPRLIEEFALEKALHRTKIVRVACGAQHSLGITEGGELYTWGSGEDGRLGHGDMRDRSVPRKVMSLLRHRVVQASCGGAHTAVLTESCALFTFGRGRNGRLGLGDNKWRDTPHEVTGFPQGVGVAQVVCGWNFTVARTVSGRLYSWGKQGEGQCGLGYVDKDQLSPQLVEKLADVTAVDVACGYTHTIVLTSTGDVYSWGLGEYGQLGRGIVYQPVPEQVDFSAVLCPPDVVTQAHCGAFHSVVTTNSRVMYAWGLNLYGACGLGHTVNKDTPERIDCFRPSRDLVVACGHKYTVAVEVDRASGSASVPANGSGRGLRIHTGSMDSLPPVLGISVVDAGLVPRADWGMPTWIPSPTNAATMYSQTSESRHSIHEREEELRKAKKLWRTRILRDWEENKDTPLAHAMWRQGIPPSIRARVWPLAIGNKLKITPEMYQIYRKRAIAYKLERDGGGAKNGGGVIGKEHTLALIDTDLPRTFPSLKLFDATGPYYEFLLEVLETYACYRPDLGYIQGMSYLAALLCLHMPQDRYLAFQCLANLMVNEHLFTFYLLDAELSDVYYKLFEEFLHSRLPELHRHFQSIGISSSMYLMNWLQTLFMQVLPLEVAVRVVDNFLLDGTVFLFRLAMAIHELLQSDLLGTEIDEAMPIIQKSHLYQDLWLTRITEDELFATIAQIAVPTHVYSALDRVVNDVFFYEKRRAKSDLSPNDLVAVASGGQSVGIGRVKNERRRMYSISDTLNGVLGGF